MSKKYKLLLAIVVIVIIISPFAGYILAKESEPFQFSEHEIQKSTSLSKIIGEVKDISLKPFGYSVKYRGSQGWAEFEIELTGTSNTGNLFLKLEKNLGKWEIVGSRFNGERISL